MNESRRNILVGLFVVASLAVLSTLMIWFGEAPEWLVSNEWQLRIVGVQELRGIDEASPVKLNGVEIGRVKSIDFLDPERPDKGVVVVAGIRHPYRVPEGAVARVYGATLGIGSGHVDLVIEEGESVTPLPPGSATVRGEMRNVLGEIVKPELIGSVEATFENVAKLAEATTPVMRNAAALLERRPVEDVDRENADVAANISTVVERIDALTANLNEVLGDETVQADVKGAVRDLKDAADAFRETVLTLRDQTSRLAGKLDKTLESTDARLDRTFGDIDSAVNELNRAARSLTSVLGAIAEGEGTAGLLVRDDRLYEAAVLAAQRLEEVLTNLKIITGKIRDDGYITVGQAPSGLFKKKFETPGGQQAAAE